MKMGRLHCSVTLYKSITKNPKPEDSMIFLITGEIWLGTLRQGGEMGKDLLRGHWCVGSTDNVLPPCHCTRCFGFHSTGRRSWGSACSRGHRCEAPEHPLQAAALCPFYSADLTKNSYCQLLLRLRVLFNFPKDLAHTVTCDKFQQFPAEVTAVL